MPNPTVQDRDHLIEEIPERQASHPYRTGIPLTSRNRLDEQHIFTTKTLGFLIHPSIPAPSTTAKIADIGAGSGAWLLDVARTLPPTCHFTGFDVADSAFPAAETLPPNVSFKMQDMFNPFPVEELGTYEVVAVRFTSSVAARAKWKACVANLMTLLKPGGWLQWIDSCNFALYKYVPGTSRAACLEIYEGLEPYRREEDPVIGLMMRELGNVGREEVWRDVGLVDVHEDVISSDRLGEAREASTRNIIACFLGCLEGLIGVDGTGWTRERIEVLKEKAMREIDGGVYHTLDQVCIIGRKPDTI
jgi:SAM-dependent methyltransferase